MLPMAEMRANGPVSLNLRYHVVPEVVGVRADDGFRHFETTLYSAGLGRILSTLLFVYGIVGVPRGMGAAGSLSDAGFEDFEKMNSQINLLRVCLNCVPGESGRGWPE